MITHIAAFIIGFAAGIAALLFVASAYSRRYEGKRIRRSPPPHTTDCYREDEPDD